MNWLGHYAILPPYAAPLTVIGGALADLGHDLNPRLRAPALIDALAGRPEAAAKALSLGVRWHLAADAVFHDDPEVMAKMTGVRLKLHAPEFSALPRRREFIAHLLVELALDAAWVVRDPGLPARYAANFSPADRVATMALLGATFPGRYPGAATLLEKFSERIIHLDDQRPETLAERLGRTLAYRLHLAPEKYPAEAMTGLFATVIEDWQPQFDELECKLRDSLAGHSANHAMSPSGSPTPNVMDRKPRHRGG